MSEKERITRPVLCNKSIAGKNALGEDATETSSRHYCRVDGRDIFNCRWRKRRQDPF